MKKQKQISKSPLYTFLKIMSAWGIQTLSLIIVAIIFKNQIQVQSILSAFVFTAVLALINALLWPLFTKFMLPITVFTFGLFTFVLNGFVMYFSSELLPGVTINGLQGAIIASFFLTIANTSISAILAVDDDQSYFRNSVKKAMLKKYKPKTETEGILFLEIDGLAEPILKKAIEKGYAPNMARWLSTGSHKLTQWETDLSSQTGASQAGILLGSNHNIPAFRWVEKKDGNKIVTSNAPKDCPYIEKIHASGKGLLVHNGASRANLFSGEAPDTIFTYSTLTNLKKLYNPAYYSFFSKPYNYVRTISFTAKDVFVEIKSRKYQEKNNVTPRLGKDKRGGVYPLLRAFTTTFLRDLTAYTLIGDIYAGQADAIYATFVGYDEVAHHSGIEDPDALHTLKQLDKQFGRLEMAVKDAPRKYRIVVLSDHGQTQGATFKQRYSMTLEDLVKSALPSDVDSTSILNTDEGWGHLNAVLSEYAGDKDKVTGKALNKALKKNMDGEIVDIQPEDFERKGSHKESASISPVEKGNSTIEKDSKSKDKKELSDERAIVLASGNLGLVYLTKFKERMTYEQIQKEYPNLIKTLTEHEGVGFVMVRSKEFGPLAIGSKGKYFIDQKRFEGENPLVNFGENVVEHIARTDSFINSPDILVNSFYDPKTKEGAAFEELIGFHGGLGGTQTEPFVLYPSAWEIPDGKIVGAEALHGVLTGWVASNEKS